MLEPVEQEEIQKQLLLIENLTKSIKMQAFHRGFQIISQDTESILFAIKEISKIIKDTK